MSQPRDDAGRFSVPNERHEVTLARLFTERPALKHGHLFAQLHPGPPALTVHPLDGLVSRAR